MGEISTVFFPFGDWKPDLSDFGHDGLIEADGVAPIGDSYLVTTSWEASSDVLTSAVGDGTPAGYWVHATDAGAGFTAYFGNNVALYELNTTNVEPWTRVNKTRAVGGPYSMAPNSSGWQGASFGDAVIMTNYTDDPQILTSPAAANFVKLAQSGGGNPGMDPKARFVFPIRNNLALAYLNLSAGFDGLPSGANPFTVCWSQSDVPRQFGSFNVTPQLIGAGYQTLAFDLGYITGAIGGEYGLIAMQRGWVRMDGPPYSFRPISQGDGCIYPNSITRLKDDVYYWGPGGPMVLRGGDGRAESLGVNRLIRFINDRLVNEASAAKLAAVPIRFSAAADPINNLVFFSYVPYNVTLSRKTFTLVYDATNDRFSMGGNPLFMDSLHGSHFIKSRPVPPSTDVLFCPGRDISGVLLDDASDDSYTGRPAQSLTIRTVTMTTGFRRLNDSLTSRIRKLRLVYSLSTGSGNPGDSMAFTIYSKNKPYDTAATFGPFSTIDSHGAIPTPTTSFADFHKVKVEFEPVAQLVKEISGIEIEFESGPAYGA